MTLSRFVAVLGFALAAHAAQPPFFNLDFEAATRGQVWMWIPASTGPYEYAADNTTAASGNQSLRIRSLGGTSKAIAGVQQRFPVELLRGHHLHLAAYIRTAGMTRGYAGFGIEVLGPSNTVLALNEMQGIGPTGTTDWQQYAIDLDVTPNAAEIILGALQTGDGTAWFDNVTLDIDGVRYADAPAPTIGEPTPDQLAWLQANANPIASTDPTTDLSDLSPMANIAGDARIVALGEGTHGTHEFFQLKHRLLEYLAQNNGFTVFAMEANMPDADLLNQYVLTGQGDPAQLLKALNPWPWYSQEVLDMVRWMRQYNAAGNGPILFTGFDMQFTQLAIPIVETFLSQAEPDFLPAALNAYRPAQSLNTTYTSVAAGTIARPPAAVIQPIIDAVHAVWQHMVDHRASYVAAFQPHDVDWAIQNALLVEQATTNVLGAAFYRDQAMATNLEWILQQNPGARVVVWAHDEHIWKNPGAMGSFIASNHGKDYVAIGSLFHAGSYNAVGPFDGVQYGALGPYPAVPSFAGTVEYLLHATGLPRFLIDLRQASPADSGSSWATGPLQYRMIGSVAQDGFDFFAPPANTFDVLLFLEQSTPSTLLPY